MSDISTHRLHRDTNVAIAYDGCMSIDIHLCIVYAYVRWEMFADWEIWKQSWKSSSVYFYVSGFADWVQRHWSQMIILDQPGVVFWTWILFYCCHMSSSQPKPNARCAWSARAVLDQVFCELTGYRAATTSYELFNVHECKACVWLELRWGQLCKGWSICRGSSQSALLALQGLVWVTKKYMQGCSIYQIIVPD